MATIGSTNFRINEVNEQDQITSQVNIPIWNSVSVLMTLARYEVL